MILAISTSAPAASAALIESGRVKELSVSPVGRTHSETILPLCEEMLQKNGLQASDMEAFAVDVGPGSFTGVRIGVCIANALGTALQKPVIAVSSLEALCFGKENVCALIDARNGNGYGMVRSGEMTLQESAVVTEDLLCTLPEGTLITGDAVELCREAIEKLAPRCTLATDNAVDAAKAGLCAWEKLMRGETTAEALPLYLRKPQAERKAGGEQ